ncbi:hypothetical protein [Azospirillum brasilense]|uniref:hypothetical protein n=1 Tax=Azospirillum brasilense TaxID=192 RepID=UPI001EDC76C2|nr:hypothetical protein [Azospirillum brasilense]UKJ75421.1 hypothetical protein H1Q64_14270 [Azospirillum brasilense]
MGQAITQHTVLEPALDGQGGLRVAGNGASTLVVGSATLRILTIEDCADLVHLDLTASPQVSWIAIARCPRLTRVSLPADGPGTELHVDFGARAPELRVTGWVADIDCCWDQGSAAAPRGRSRRPPLAGCCIGALDPTAAERVELVIFVGADSALRHLHVPASAAREVVLVDCASLETLTFGAAAAALCVEVHNLPRLTRITSDAPVRLLRAERCQRLQHIRGFGDAATVLASARRERLEVLGPWSSLVVRDSAPAGIEAPLVERVSAPGRVHGEAAESAVRHLLEAARAGDTQAVGALLHWCGRVRTRRGVLGALIALDALAVAGSDVEALWAVRCGLRHRSVGRGARPDDWWWDLPHDLEQRGWDADLRLWLRYQASASPEPSDAPALQPWHPVHFVTLAAALREPGPRAAAITTLLMRAFGSERFGRLQERRRTDRPSLDANDTDRLRRTVQALSALRDHPHARALVAAFGRWLVRNTQGPDRANLLGALHLLGAADARACLLRLAAGDANAAADEQTLALALAMAPTRAAIFRFDEVLHA